MSLLRSFEPDDAFVILPSSQKPSSANLSSKSFIKIRIFDIILIYSLEPDDTFIILPIPFNLSATSVSIVFLIVFFCISSRTNFTATGLDNL